MSGFVVTESVARMTMEERAEFEQLKLEIKAIAKGDFSSELKAISE
jgi:hypothetical protein